ncbi:MAG: hypothetical protein PVG39_23545 [Desulfobacteraceae bacterium]|jgi:ssDNA-binding Zn-finger/Zn-ribbon topoisomerase 1
MANETIQESNENKVAETDKEQPDNAQGNSIDNLELIKNFNDILGNHIELLLDTRFGIEELELDIFSISCIVLLATRETEIETFPASPPARYTESDLIEELAEMSIEPDSEVKKVIEAMINKGYLKITDERLFCNKPMGSMAQLFDRIFPKMPGLNLVAYLGQMLDEVLAGRKSQEEASRQFNQMLEIQGVSVNEPETPKPVKKKFSYLRLGDDTPTEKKVKKPRAMPGKPANIFSQLTTGTFVKTPVTAKENIQSQIEKEIKDGSDTPVTSEETAGKSPDVLTDSREIEDVVADTGLEKEEAQDIEKTPETTDQEQKVSDSFEPADDKEIEDKILEFEEQLGLKCPLCGTGGIKTSETAKGKAYYHCSSIECNFISWGKPYYFECPKCDSNFLIEVTDSSGKSFLKCPKATCTHWQKFPWDVSDQSPEYSGSDADSGSVINKPKRKVRRRRVVRRKKSA